MSISMSDPSNFNESSREYFEVAIEPAGVNVHAFPGLWVNVYDDVSGLIAIPFLRNAAALYTIVPQSNDKAASLRLFDTSRLTYFDGIDPADNTYVKRIVYANEDRSITYELNYIDDDVLFADAITAMQDAGYAPEAIWSAFVELYNAVDQAHSVRYTSELISKASDIASRFQAFAIPTTSHSFLHASFVCDYLLGRMIADLNMDSDNPSYRLGRMMVAVLLHNMLFGMSDKIASLVDEMKLPSPIFGAPPLKASDFTKTIKLLDVLPQDFVQDLCASWTGISTPLLQN